MKTNTTPDLFGDSVVGKTRNPDLFAGRDEGRGVLPAPVLDPDSDETREERDLRHGFDHADLLPLCDDTMDIWGES